MRCCSALIFLHIQLFLFPSNKLRPVTHQLYALRVALGVLVLVAAMDADRVALDVRLVEILAVPDPEPVELALALPDCELLGESLAEELGDEEVLGLSLTSCALLYTISFVNIKAMTSQKLAKPVLDRIKMLQFLGRNASVYRSM